MIHHLKYKIDKEKYRNIFFDNIQRGQWHWAVPTRKELFWYQLFISDNDDLKPLFKDLESDLNIVGMNNFPRFNYQFPNTIIPHHKDINQSYLKKDDEYKKPLPCTVSLNINLLETVPTIHINHKPYSYECAIIHTGGHMHGVEPDSNPRLILKFCFANSWDEIKERFRNLIE